MSVQEIAEEDFVHAVLESDLPVLVDFYSEWCAPCRLMAPEVEALAKELHGKVRVFKVDIGHSPNVASYLEIESLPTVMLFKDGEGVDGVSGLMRRSQLRKFVRQHVHLN